MNQKFNKLGMMTADILLPRQADMSKWSLRSRRSLGKSLAGILASASRL